MTNRFARVLRIADATGPRSTVACVLAAAIGSLFIVGFVHGLSGSQEPPAPLAPLDVHIVQLAPPPPPPPQSPAAPAPAAAPHRPLVRTPHRPMVPSPPVTVPSPRRAEPHATLPVTPPSASPTHPGAPTSTPPASAGATTTAPSAASGDGPAHAILQPLPVIPDDLREEAFQAVAMARFSIQVDGSVAVELIKPTHNPRLNQLLLDTLRKWRFFPALKNGQPIATHQDIRVHFNVN